MLHEDLDSRVASILRAIVEWYIRTGEPVGSRTLSKVLDLNLSAATIRNVMADLTEQGLLVQPHTSAGRVPTHRAYREYVNHHTFVEEVPAELEDAVEETLEQSPAGLDALLQATGKLLSHFTHFTSVVASPRLNHTRLRLVEFLRIEERHVCVALVTQSNLVFSRIFTVNETLTEERLRQVSATLTERFADQSLQTIRSQLLDSLVAGQEQFDPALAQLVRLSKKAFDLTPERELYVDGQSYLMDGDYALEHVAQMLRALEEKDALVSLLDETVNQPGVHVSIGVEIADPAFHECAMVQAGYSNEHGVLGAIGIIGPTRMNYLQVAPIIGYTARRLSQAIANQ